MQIAGFVGTRPGWQGVANRLIRARLSGAYSHTELVFESHDPVAAYMPDRSTQPDAAGALWSASSVAAERLPGHSPRRAGCVGGVRIKRIAFDPARWRLLPVPAHVDVERAARWFAEHAGDRYDWALISKSLAWLMPEAATRWTCSESVAAACGLRDAWRYDPCTLIATAAWSTTP